MQQWWGANRPISPANRVKERHTPPPTRCIFFVAPDLKEKSKMSRAFKYFILPLVAVLGCLVLPEQSMALQTHSQPEGIYVHQMAHIFYIAALGYLFWDTKRSTFSGRGWVYLRIFCVLTILWNILAFIGHEITPYLHPEDFSNTTEYLQTQLNGPLTLVKFLYYIAKLDHLLAVPAMFFLYLGLRSFYKSSLSSGEEV